MATAGRMPDVAARRPGFAKVIQLTLEYKVFFAAGVAVRVVARAGLKLQQQGNARAGFSAMFSQGFVADAGIVGELPPIKLMR